MEILITGAHGFVGTRLMKELEGAIAVSYTHLFP